MAAVKRLRLDEPRVAVPILIGLALVLRLPNLRESLWLDEVLYSTHARMPGVAGLWEYFRTNSPAPLYSTVLFFWVGLFGEHQLIIRLPSLMFGVASIPLTFYVARQFVRGTGPFVAALFLCLTPAHVWYSQEATPYTMAMCLLLVAVAARPSASAEPRRFWPIAIYTAALTAACMTHYYVAVFLLPLTLIALQQPPAVRRRMIDAHFVAVSVMASALVIQAIGGSLFTVEGARRPMTLFSVWMVFFNWFLHGNTIWRLPYRTMPELLLGSPLLIAVQLIACALVIRGVWLKRIDPPATPRWELALFVCVLPLALWSLTLAGQRHVYIERYLLVAIPFFAIALARGVVTFRRPAFRQLAVAFVFAIGVLSYAGWLRQDDVWTVYKQNPDWRSAAAFLSQEQKTGARFRILAVIPIDDFLFYVRKALPQDRLDVVLDPQNRDPLERPDPAVQLVLVRNLYWTSGVEAVIARYQRESRLEFLGKAAFKGVELYRFRLKR